MAIAYTRPVPPALLLLTVATLRPPSDPGQIAVLEVDEPCTVYAGDDTWLVSLRAVARRFAESRGGGFDHLVVFSAFSTTVGGSAVYHAVANDVRGLNVDRDGANPELFDHSDEYGLPGLQGVVQVGSLSELPDDPEAPFLGVPSVLTLLAHELAHRFGPFVRFAGPEDAGPRDDLLGAGLGHWSFFLDTGGSPLGGNRWLEVEEGRFVSGEPSGAWSGLDLYLLGLLPPEEVPPLALLEDPSVLEPPLDAAGRAWSRESEARPGVVVEATPRAVGVEEVVAAEGPRDPAWDRAPHAWRQAFVLLVRPGGDPAPEALPRLARLRAAWARHFHALTGGRGRVLTDLDGRDDLPDFRFSLWDDGWRAPGEPTEPPVTRDGALVVPAGVGTLVHDDLRIDAAADDVLELRLSAGAPETGWGLAFRPEGSDWPAAPLPLLPGSGEWVLVARLDAAQAWQGRVDGLRLHLPAGRRDDLGVDSVLLRPRRPDDPAPAAPQPGCGCTVGRPPPAWLMGLALRRG